MNSLVNNQSRRRPHRRGPGRQSGMAVIGALVVVAVTAVAATAILERQTLMADTLIGERDRAQARWLLRGGLDWARIVLLNDARHNALTLKQSIWAQPIAGLDIAAPGQAGHARFSGLIEDEQGKYNVQRLAVQGAVQPAELAAFERLLTGLGLPTALAAPVARRVADAQPRPQGQPTAPGLRSVRDLLGVDGIGRDTVALLMGHVTVLPQPTAINVNTASPEVLSASLPRLDMGQARALVEQREQGQWFNSRGDFANRLGDPSLVAGAQLAVRSDWFQVTGDVSLAHARVGMQALLHRRDDAAPVVIWVAD